MPNAAASAAPWGLFDDGLVRMRAVPVHVQVLPRPNGDRVLTLLRDGVAIHREVLSPAAAAHLAAVLAAGKAAR